jgi:hypothetical protein
MVFIYDALGAWIGKNGLLATANPRVFTILARARDKTTRLEMKK